MRETSETGSACRSVKDYERRGGGIFTGVVLAALSQVNNITNAVNSQAFLGILHKKFLLTLWVLLGYYWCTTLLEVFLCLVELNSA